VSDGGLAHAPAPPCGIVDPLAATASARAQIALTWHIREEHPRVEPVRLPG